MSTFYASPSGTSGGDGSIGSPWDLQTALDFETSTNHTIYLRGGTYNLRAISTRTAGTVMSYPGEWAVIDGYVHTTLTSGIDDNDTTFDVGSTAGMPSTQVVVIDDEHMQISVVDSDTLNVARGWNSTTPAAHLAGADVYLKSSGILTVNGGDNTVYRDFEIKNSSTFRDQTANSAAHAFDAGISVIGSCDSNEFVGLVIHDTGLAMFIGSSTSNTIVEDCINFNNGLILADGNPAGQGIYTENSAGYSRIWRNAFINNWNGNQFYGVSGPYVGGDHRENLVLNGGALSTGTGFNYTYGPNAAASATASIIDSHFFQKHDISVGSGATIGYGAGITALTLNDNYFTGGVASLTLQTVGSITGGGNDFYLDSATFGYTEIFAGPTYPTGTWDNNTYHNATGKDYFGRQGVGYVSFAAWQSATSYDASSTTTAAARPDTVVVIPSQRTTGRANIIIYAASDPADIDVDLSTTGLTDGQAYTIKNLFDYNGTSVTSGTYNASSPTITVSLSGAITNVASPTSGSTPTTTVPELAALVVVPSESVVARIGNATIKNVTFA